MTEDGVTLLIVIDDEEQSRMALLEAVRRLGLRALAVDTVADAAALLEALDADVTVVHGAGADDGAALERLRQKTLVVVAPRETPLEETVVALLRALGRPEEAALIN